jgi:beta-lactam-binding protein with PASTA domain
LSESSASAPITVDSAINGAELFSDSKVVALRLDEARLLRGEVTYVFSDTTAKGQVIEMSSPDGLSLSPNMELDVGVTIDLLMSAGSLPDVTGLSVEEAEALLSDAGLTGVVGGDGDYSDTIAEGLVIDFVRPQGVTLRPGDTVTLTVSRGPELITVPDVVGKTIQDAVDELRALGLTVEVRSEYPETAWDESFARVTSLEPSAGQQVPIGSKVIIRSFV